MRKGVSFTLTVVVIGLILLTTALTVIIGSQSGIQNVFATGQEETSASECDLQINRVRQGQTPPSEVTEECRSTLTGNEWEDLKKEYEQQQIGDILTGQ